MEKKENDQKSMLINGRISSNPYFFFFSFLLKAEIFQNTDKEEN